MLRLFLKIFLICLTALAVVSLSTAYFQKDKTSNRQDNQTPAQTQEIVQNIYDTEGYRGLNRWIRRNKKHNLTTLLADHDSPLLNHGFKRVHKHHSGLNAWVKGVLNPTPHIMLTTQEYGEQKIRLMKMHRGPGGRPIPPPPPRSPWPVLLIIITISLLVAFYMTRPLKRLSRDIRDWHSREISGAIDTDIAKRKDALGDLGKELNDMSSNITSLLEQQKQLLRDVSHELRSPMARIRVATELLKHPDYQNNTNLLHSIENEIETLDQMVEELLTLQRWQSQNPSEVLEDYDLSVLLTTLQERLKLETDQKNLTLIRKQNNDSLMLHGYPKPLERALENILRNAIRFSPHSGTISIELSKHPRQYHLTITDEGPGVNEDQIEHLFDPFYRTDNARTPGGKSIGVGLTIAREGIEINSGKVTAHNCYSENKQRCGLTMVITLPTKQK